MTSTRTLNVEASSLSSITDIASNPPSHPGIPIDGPLQPLTLYIAKVPGSQDVFLTPLKPREKIVTAQDVLSALYYVHFNSDDDRRFDEEPPLAVSPGATDLSRQITVNGGSVQRKPIPPPRSPKPAELPTPPGSESEYFPPFPERKPVASRRRQEYARKPFLVDRTHDRAGYQHDLDLPEIPLGDRINNRSGYPRELSLPDIPRRPLPSPKAEQHQYGNSLHDNNRHLLHRSEYSEENNPYRRSYHESEDGLPSPSATERSPPLSPDIPEPGTLTLIRRDPGSSEQWNVATIHDPLVHEVSSGSLLSPALASSRTKKGGAPMFLDVTNPGYLQFIDPDDRPVSRNSTSTDSYDEPPPSGTFRRRMYMPGSAFAEHRYSPSNRNTLDLSRASFPSASGTSMDIPRTLRPSYPELQQSASTTPSSGLDPRSKSYTFPSPYPNGHCTFSTSSSGRSLRCRHVFPTISTSTAQNLSELRFNLPVEPQRLSNHGHSSSYSGSSTLAVPGRESKRRSLGTFGRKSRDMFSDLGGSHDFATASHSNNSRQSLDVRGSFDTRPSFSSRRSFDARPSSDFDARPSLDSRGEEPFANEDVRMDLRLGQERAGGGLGGKQAKLGKLIVEVEGLKMLDLLVAANVGLWWRAYGRGKG